MLKGSAFLLTLVLASALSLIAQSNGDFASGSTERPLQRSSSLLVNHAQSVSGTVTTFNGQPMKGARVEVRNLATGEIIGSAYTLDNGSFEIANIPTGTYGSKGEDSRTERRCLFESSHVTRRRQRRRRTQFGLRRPDEGAGKGTQGFEEGP